MMISSAEIERSGVDRIRANSIITSIGRLIPIKWRTTHVKNKLGHLVTGNRKYVDIHDAIAALEQAIKDAPDTGNAAKISSIPNKRKMIRELKVML